jgi:hypothetical protein
MPFAGEWEPGTLENNETDHRSPAQVEQRAQRRAAMSIFYKSLSRAGGEWNLIGFRVGFVSAFASRFC